MNALLEAEKLFTNDTEHICELRRNSNEFPLLKFKNYFT